jgi:peptidyl-tRNA hydrolase, PTH1 family
MTTDLNIPDPKKTGAIPAIPIRLIVGLGNYGKEYEDTRHNAGFWFVDQLAAQLGASFAKDNKFFGWVCKVKVNTAECWLLKPATYMNRSGQAVAALANFYRIQANEILAVHDELDMLPGIAKLKLGGGTGGHNGLKDIQAKIGTANYWRLRLGIGHPRTLNLAQEVADFVLHAPRRDDRKVIGECIDSALAIAPQMITGQMELAVKTFHTIAK